MRIHQVIGYSIVCVSYRVVKVCTETKIQHINKSYIRKLLYKSPESSLISWVQVGLKQVYKLCTIVYLVFTLVCWRPTCWPFRLINNWCSVFIKY